MDEDIEINGNHLNSPYVEYKPVPEQYSYLGKKSVEAILENWVNNRADSRIGCSCTLMRRNYERL